MKYCNFFGSCGRKMSLSFFFSLFYNFIFLGYTFTRGLVLRAARWQHHFEHKNPKLDSQVRLITAKQRQLSHNC